MRIICLVLLLLLSSSAFGQDGTRIHRHKFYDTTKVEDLQKIKRRRLTADVDSTGIALYAWGDECYFKINLLQRMLINANFYETGTYRDHPYVKYGNDNFRFRMYVNASGNFEFDAIVRHQSANGRYNLPFNIQTQGLVFLFQDSAILTDDPKVSTPDSVLNSYAVYHRSRKNNIRRINGSDTTYENYGTGKAFHIYRPRAWDNAGDTVWGMVEIDTILNRMTIATDSAWMANAVYPVTIDPIVGVDSAGAFGIIATDCLWQSIVMPEDGTLDSIATYAAGYEDLVMYAGIYAHSGHNPGAKLETESNGFIPAGWPAYLWYKVAMAGTLNLTDGTTYDLAILGVDTNSSAQRISADYNPIYHNHIQNIGSWPAFGLGANELDYQLSVYAIYSVEESGIASRRRRKLLLQSRRM